MLQCLLIRNASCPSRPPAPRIGRCKPGARGALGARDKGLMGMLLRYPYEVRDASEYFDDIQDVKITKDMLDLAKHIVQQKSGHFEPEKFEDHYEAALTDLINKKGEGARKEGGLAFVVAANSPRRPREGGDP